MARDVQSYTHWLRPATPSILRTGTRMRERYWSAKIDDISLYPLLKGQESSPDPYRGQVAYLLLELVAQLLTGIAGYTVS
jgi:hypothetical protein